MVSAEQAAVLACAADILTWLSRGAPPRAVLRNC
jgi:hypothetical protein